MFCDETACRSLVAIVGDLTYLRVMQRIGGFTRRAALVVLDLIQSFVTALGGGNGDRAAGDANLPKKNRPRALTELLQGVP